MSGRSSTDTLLSGSFTCWPPPDITTVPHLQSPTSSVPSHVTFGAGLAKLVAGLLCAVLAGMALMVDADLSSVGGGFWAGALAALTGALGVATGRKSHTETSKISYGPHPMPKPNSKGVALVCLGVVSLAASGLLVVLSGTGLAHDATERWPDRSSREPAIAVNAVLLTLATVDCVASIFTLAAALRLTCGPPNADASVERSSRLRQWLKAQRLLLLQTPNDGNNAVLKPFQPMPHPVVYTLGPPPTSPPSLKSQHCLAQQPPGTQRTRVKPTPEISDVYCPHMHWKGLPELAAPPAMCEYHRHHHHNHQHHPKTRDFPPKSLPYSAK